jgi:hypothetical protein
MGFEGRRLTSFALLDTARVLATVLRNEIAIGATTVSDRADEALEAANWSQLIASFFFADETVAGFRFKTQALQNQSSSPREPVHMRDINSNRRRACINPSTGEMISRGAPIAAQQLSCCPAFLHKLFARNLQREPRYLAKIVVWIIVAQAYSHRGRLWLLSAHNE